MQIEALRILGNKVTPHHLVRSGAVPREVEAKHLIDLLKDAEQSLKEYRDREEAGDWDNDE